MLFSKQPSQRFSRGRVLSFVGALLLVPVLGALSKREVPSTSASKVEIAKASIESIPTRAYFGDTHLHTAYSADAGMVGTTVGPEDAYRFVLGQQVTSNTGLQAKLKRPYDFVVIADHAENMGLQEMIGQSDPGLLNDPFGKQLYDLVKAGKGYEAYLLILNTLGEGGDKAEIKSESMKRSAWNTITTLAEKYNDPGKFTAFIGYEWTSQPGGNNLHRVVVFRDDKTKAEKVLPFSAFDSDDVEDLWAYMQNFETNTGGKVLAIPHNGNLSNGMMFDPFHQKDDSPIDSDYARQRNRFEPLYEVTQEKGTAEAHPLLSPEDDFAPFEVYDKGNLSGSQAKTNAMLPYEYARPALKLGLQLDNQLGVNPFKFGLVGSTDSHTGLSTTEEDNWFGKANILEPSPNRWKDVLIKSLKDPSLDMTAQDLAASGLAAVWAHENTREALFDAMARKEVYGTTGTRLQVRVFGGFDFAEVDLNRSDFAKNGYANGVPMGGDLSNAPSGKAPAFLIQAMRDPMGANLDRIQIVKGWLSADGQTHEKVYNVAWGDADKRKPAADGTLPVVGNSVNLQEATYSNSIGDPVLKGYWQDPDFDSKQKAFYYVRVMEIPTPRWLAYDRKRFNLFEVMPKDIRYVSQERAYTSPIWYNPI